MHKPIIINDDTVKQGKELLNEYINAIQKKCQASKDEVAVQIAKTKKNKDEVIGYFADKLKIDDSKGVTKKTTPQY
jgi:ribosomal protein S17E